MDRRPVLWNGHVNWLNETSDKVVTMNCLKDWNTRSQWDVNNLCHGLNPDMDQMPEDGGESVEPEGCDSGSDSSPPESSISPPPTSSDNPASASSSNSSPQSSGGARVRRRRDKLAGGSCAPAGPKPLDPGSQDLTFSSASVAQPTCSAPGACGGTLCSGYYCAPSPTGTPPDHQDPRDPNNGQPVSSSTVSLSWSTEAPAPTTLSSWISELMPSTTSSSADTDGPGSNPSGTTGGGGSNPSGTTDAAQPTQTCDDQCRLDKGNPCCADGEPCQADEPSCCKRGNCPICLCSDTSCTATSPKCCLTNSCAWSWTGGNGGNKAVAVLHQLDNQLASIANSSAAVYGLWSHHGNGSDGDSWHISGYDGKMTADSVCKETPAWSAFATLNNDTNLDTGLQTWYSNLTVFGDSCSYLAGVSDYAGVAAGVKVGALTCGKWSTANCFRANRTDVHDCGTGKVAQELVCQW
ncbi:hypothetical protein PG995_012530 [Apiospora arundinis]